MVLNPGGRATVADVAARLSLPLRIAARLLREAEGAGLVASSRAAAHQTWGDRVHWLTDKGVLGTFEPDPAPHATLSGRTDGRPTRGREHLVRRC